MKSKHLPLIVDTFEKLRPINESTEDSAQELRRKYFRETLLKQFESDKSNLITETEFLNNCKNEVTQLKYQVIEHINLIKHNQSAYNIFKIKGSNQSKIDKKKAIDIIENQVNERYGKNTYITITNFVNTAKKEMCINDIEFIESVFECINFIKPRQTEDELLDLSDNKPLEKIALLHELGILKFLHLKDGKEHTINSIAILLSGITGVDVKTIQPAINSLIKGTMSRGKPAEKSLQNARAKITDSRY